MTKTNNGGCGCTSIDRSHCNEPDCPAGPLVPFKPNRRTRLKLWWMTASRKIVSRQNWLLIIGPDISNSDYGLSFHRGPLPPLGDWKMWRNNWRVNIRWPVTIRYRRHGAR